MSEPCTLAGEPAGRPPGAARRVRPRRAGRARPPRRHRRGPAGGVRRRRRVAGRCWPGPLGAVALRPRRRRRARRPTAASWWPAPSARTWSGSSRTTRSTSTAITAFRHVAVLDPPVTVAHRDALATLPVRARASGVGHRRAHRRAADDRGARAAHALRRHLEGARRRSGRARAARPRRRLGRRGARHRRASRPSRPAPCAGSTSASRVSPRRRAGVRRARRRTRGGACSLVG